MTSEQQRVSVAEWCGWKRRQLGSVFVYYRESNPHEMAGAIPNYAHDLNAIWEVEAKLDQDQQVAYMEILCSDTSSEEVCDLNPVLVEWNLLHATAAQRLEALCRTLWPGRWKGGDK